MSGIVLKLHFTYPCFLFMTGFQRITNRFEYLYKVGFDNVNNYLQKKQQRIIEHQLKRTMSQKAKCNKRPKEESDEVLIKPSV